EPRPGARARDAAVPRALRRGRDAARRSDRMAPRLLPLLRMGTRFRRHHAERRSAPHLRPLCRSVVLRRTHLSVLLERRPDADHVVRDARRTLPRLRVRRLPPLHEGVRRPERDASGHGVGGFDRHAAAGCGGDSEGVSWLIPVFFPTWATRPTRLTWPTPVPVVWARRASRPSWRAR